MSETSIAWTHYTFNPWWGCVRVSPGCEHCYAETFSHRLGLKIWGTDAPRRFFDDKHWNEPLKWARRVRERKDPRHLVFCASMADVFEDRRDLDTPRARLFELIERTPELTWQLLTKRPEKIETLAPAAWLNGWPANVWAMVTAEDQQSADKRIPILLTVPARVRCVSYEPALGPINFWGWFPHEVELSQTSAAWKDGVKWIIVGGESGHGARPFHVDWARSAIRQCREAGVACFVKQLGAYPIYGTEKGARAHLASAKGQIPSEWPEDLRVREFPGGKA